jgi:radical SAM protein with 4Fe4S-binding SPASM domain
MAVEATPFAALEDLAKSTGRPWDGSIELTWRCNERCAMCYLGPDWGRGRKNDELSTSEVFSLLDQIHDAGCFELMLTGGEVCLRPDLIDIVDYAGSKGFCLILKTNGTMMTRELAEALHRNPFRNIEMSLLGASAETHDAVTKIPGSFDRTMRGIQMVREAGHNVKLYFTALKLNYREVVQTRRLAESMGCEFEWSAQIQPRDDRSVIPLSLRLDPAEQVGVQELRVKENLEITGGMWESSGYQSNGWFCGAGKFSFNVTPYGEVQPCILMRMDCGNVREKSFQEIWETSPELRRLRGLKIAEVYGCSTCEIRDYCAACPGLFFMEMGDVTIPSPHICEQTELKHQAHTGAFKPAGSRDAEGNFPRAANVLFGGAGHQPIPLKTGSRPLTMESAPRSEA